MVDEKNNVTRDDVMRSTFMAGRVKRWHTWPTLHPETVDEHSMGVLRIYREVFSLTSCEVVRFIMDHDLPELHVGDLPFPAKRKNPRLKAAVDESEQDARILLGLPTEYRLSPLEQKQVKICDYLQMWQFGRAETRLGNSYAVAIVQDMGSAALSAAAEAGDGVLLVVTNWMREESAR